MSANERPGHDSDTSRALGAWLARKLGWEAAYVSATTKPGSGLSAGTFFARATGPGGECGDFVVRVPPPDGEGVFPVSDLARELRVQRLLGDAGVPVAETIEVEADASVLGAPFVVTRRVEGLLVDSSDPYPSRGWLHDSPARMQRSLLAGFFDVVADVHRIPGDAAVTADVCTPAACGTRAAVERWRRYLDWADRGAAPEALRRAFDWCAENVPPEEPEHSLVWGDAQLANAVFSNEGRTEAILDFELATVGPAELDLGWFFCLHDLTVRRCGSDLPGFSDRSSLTERYERRLGRKLAPLAWYENFAAACTASVLVRMSALLSGGGGDFSWLARSNPAMGYLEERLGGIT